MDPVEFEVVPTSDGMLSFVVVDSTIAETESAEFVMTYDAAAILYARLGELLAAKPA